MTIARGELTPAQVRVMEETLAAHYGEPVLPVSRYCDAFRTWVKVAHESSHDDVRALAAALTQGQIAISKSNLLWRLIYLGHPLRTERCPIHQGRWSGYGDCACNLGGTFSDMTGWLATPESPGGDSHYSQSLIRAVAVTLTPAAPEPAAFDEGAA